jgi:hypothetical protein
MHLMLHLIDLLSFLLIGATLFGEDVEVPDGPVSVPTTAETLVTVGRAVSLPTGNGKAVVRGWVEMTIGAGTTAITLTIYEGTAIGGPVVGQKIPDAGSFTPGSNATFEAEFIDMLSEVTGAQYCMSVLQTGATGNGTVLAALLDTKVLSG